MEQQREGKTKEHMYKGNEKQRGGKVKGWESKWKETTAIRKE